MKYKNLIGEILLDNIPTAKTVVAKNDTLGTESKVENKFRILPMELIAGENNFKTVHVEHGNRFELDLEQTYWNSRLQEEHKIMADLIERDSKVVDLCCGIGPFVIPIAKRGFDIIANDLNPGKSMTRVILASFELSTPFDLQEVKLSGLFSNFSIRQKSL